MKIISVPPNLEVYDSLWHCKKGFNINRRTELQKLMAPYTWAMRNNEFMNSHSQLSDAEDLPLPLPKNCLDDKKVLDLCAGHGAYSLAAAEMGAKEVWMVDGSFRALVNFNERLKSIENKNLKISKIKCKNIIKQHQVDADRLERVLPDQYFDFSFCRYGIMHLQDPFLAIFYLAKATKIGGTIGFNFFGNGNVRPSQREIRKLLFNTQVSYIQQFVKKANLYMKKSELNTGSPVFASAEIQKIASLFQTLINKYGVEEIQNHCLHEETLCTPYIHCIPLNIMTDMLMNLKMTGQELMTSSHNEEGNQLEIWITATVTKEFHKLAESRTTLVEDHLEDIKVQQHNPVEFINGRVVCRRTGNMLG